MNQFLHIDINTQVVFFNMNVMYRIILIFMKSINII